MGTTIRQALAVATAIAFVHLSADVSAQASMHVTQIEIAQLPQFCWGRYGVPDATGPEFNMPSGCGYAMNHYCDGLVFLIRAQHASNKNGRMSLLGMADQNIRYTEGSMEGHPNCPVRDHVAASRARVDELMTVYGGRRAKKR